MHADARPSDRQPRSAISGHSRAASELTIFSAVEANQETAVEAGQGAPIPDVICGMSESLSIAARDLSLQA
jgi:hypothetical protein